MTPRYVTLHVADGIGWVQFNRADKLNALNPDVLDDLSAVLSDCEKENEIRVVVLKGHDKAFIAGADIGYMAEGDVSLAYRLSAQTAAVQDRLAGLDKPTIAAISGYALGGDAKWPCAAIFGSERKTASWGCRKLKSESFPAAAAPNDSRG